jgi:hypothetical protein
LALSQGSFQQLSDSTSLQVIFHPTACQHCKPDSVPSIMPASKQNPLTVWLADRTLSSSNERQVVDGQSESALDLEIADLSENGLTSTGTKIPALMLSSRQTTVTAWMTNQTQPANNEENLVNSQPGTTLIPNDEEPLTGCQPITATKALSIPPASHQKTLTAWSAWQLQPTRLEELIVDSQPDSSSTLENKEQLSDCQASAASLISILLALSLLLLLSYPRSHLTSPRNT